MDNHMQVAMRLRPILDNTLNHENKQLLHVYNHNIFTEVDNNKIADRVIYDYILEPSDDNKEVFKIIKPMVESFIQGTNGTVFVYGQKGSGKQYTVYGAYNDLGIAYMTLNEVTSYFSLNEHIKYSMKAAFVEVSEDDQLIDLQDVVTEECARRGIQFTNDMGDLLERARFMYKSHNHVVLSFKLQYEDPTENKTCESQFNFVLLADPTGKDKNKDHTHFTMSLLFTYLHLLSANAKEIDSDKMLLSSILSKAVGKYGKSLFIGTLSPSDPKNSLITIKKMKLLKGPDSAFDRATNHETPEVPLNEFKGFKENRESDDNGMRTLEEEDEDLEEQDFVTRVDSKHRKYITEIPPEYYRELDSMGFLICTPKTNAVSCFTIAQKEDKIGSSQMLYLPPEDLLPTTMNDDTVYYENEIFAKICKEEQELQVNLNKLRGLNPLEGATQTDLDLLDLLVHKRMNTPGEDVNIRSDVAGCSTQQRSKVISEIEFKYLDTPRTDYQGRGSDADDDSQKGQSDNEHTDNEDDEKKCTAHEPIIQHLSDLLKENQRDSKHLEYENMTMKNRIDELMNKNKDLFDYIRKIKSTLYSIVNKEVYKAKFIYKSNVKVYDKFYKCELENLRRMYVEAQDFSIVIFKLEEEKRKSSLIAQGKPVAKVPNICSTDNIPCFTNLDKDGRKINVLNNYLNQMNAIKNSLACDLDVLQNSFKKMAEFDCETCSIKHDCCVTDEECFRKDCAHYDSTLNMISLILFRNVVYFHKMMHTNNCMLSDLLKLEKHFLFLNQVTKNIKYDYGFNENGNYYPPHRMFMKKMIVKTSLQHMKEMEKEILLEQASKADENMDNDASDEANMSGLGMPKTPMDNKFGPEASGLVNSAIIMEELLSSINVLFNNLPRLLSEKVDCADCKRFTKVLIYKVIQLVSIKTQYNMWSKDITMEDTSIDFYLNFTNELLEMTNSISDSKKMKLMQYKLMQRKVYYENSLTLIVNKRTYVDKILTILIDSTAIFQEMLKEKEGHDENCKFRTCNIVITLLFSHIRERIVITLFYLDNLEELNQNEKIMKRINELDMAIGCNEQFLKDFFPASDPAELRNIEIEHEYLISLYNLKMLRMEELENLIKHIPINTPLPQEYKELLESIRNTKDTTTYATELTVTTAELPTEIPICTPILRAKRMIDTSAKAADGKHEPMMLSNITPNEYALRMFEVKKAGVKRFGQIATIQFNPRKRPIDATDIGDSEPNRCQFLKPSTSRSTYTPRPLEPPMSFLQMRFKGPAATLAPPVQFAPRYMVQNEGQYAIRSKPIFNERGESSQACGQSAGSFEPVASTSRNMYVKPLPPYIIHDSSSEEEDNVDECVYEDITPEGYSEQDAEQQ